MLLNIEMTVGQFQYLELILTVIEEFILILIMRKLILLTPDRESVPGVPGRETPENLENLKNLSDPVSVAETGEVDPQDGGYVDQPRSCH